MKELLENAAKAMQAAGRKDFTNFSVVEDGLSVCLDLGCRPGAVTSYWRPQDNNGDAFDIMVTLHIKAGYDTNMPPEPGMPRECGFAVTPTGQWFAEDNPQNPPTATRLAILRAAASIGEQLP